LRRRHFWRYATFSEVAELYASRLLRLTALNIAATFMSIYLYQQGIPLLSIALYWSAFYAFKVLFAIPMAALAARIGPKHGILIANILYIPAMIAFALAPIVGFWVLAIVLVLKGLSSSLYMISYSIDFSKVKSNDHAGKEIAYMNIVEKITAGLSPLIGGLLALFFGPQVVLIVAAVLFLLAAAPLFKTAEQELPNQKLVFRGFSWRLVGGIFFAQIARGFDFFASATMWSLYVAIFIIGITASNEVYVINGLLLSVVLFAALGASYTYGKLIDNRRGRDLLRIATIANAMTHALRPTIGTPVSVAGLNIANEAATTGSNMSFVRGIFDNADLSGHRATYMGVLDVLMNFGAMLAALTVALLVYTMDDRAAFSWFFYITAGVVLLVLTARFPLYRK